MTRLPYADPERLPAPAREALDAVPPLGVFRMMANAETAFRPWLRWGGVLLGDLALDPLLRELAILRVARLTPHADYEWVQHAPIARAMFDYYLLGQKPRAPAAPGTGPREPEDESD